jgi:hypothetical protein
VSTVDEPGELGEYEGEAPVEPWADEAWTVLEDVLNDPADEVKIKAGIRRLARLTYYCQGQMVEQGFPDGAAFDLTCIWYKSVLDLAVKSELDRQWKRDNNDGHGL